jgi:hypothetical protein
MIPMGAIARINDGGLRFLCNELTDMITADQIDSILKSQNPIFDEEIDLWGFTIASAIVNVENTTMNEPIYIHINAEKNVLETMLIITNLRIYVEAHGEIMEIPWSAHGEVFADQIIANVDAGMNVWEGKFQVYLTNYPNVELNGFGFDINNFPDELESWFYDDVRVLIEEAFEDEIAAQLPDQLNELFAELEFFGQIYENLMYEAIAYDTNINESGATAMLEGMVYTDYHDECVPPQQGSRYTPNQCPVYGYTIPGTNREYDFAVSLSDDMLNQILFATYDAGLMCLDIEDPEYLNTTVWRFFLPELYEIAPDSPIILRLLPKHSPVVMVGALGEMLGMYVPKLTVEFLVYIEEELQRAFSIRIDAKGLGGVHFREEENSLKLYLDELEVKSTILTEDLCNIKDPALERYQPWLMEYILPTLVKTIEAFPIPSFEGYTIKMKAVMADGINNNFVSIYGDLKKSSRGPAQQYAPIAGY